MLRLAAWLFYSLVVVGWSFLQLIRQLLLRASVMIERLLCPVAFYPNSADFLMCQVDGEHAMRIRGAPF